MKITRTQLRRLLLKEAALLNESEVDVDTAMARIEVVRKAVESTEADLSVIKKMLQGIEMALDRRDKGDFSD